MAASRRRVPYFNVPASQQPLRIRARDIRQAPRPVERDNPLEQLIVGNLFHSHDGQAPLPEPDWIELMDAAHEDAHGRLPHESGFLDPWMAIADVEPVDPGDLEPEPDTFIPMPDETPIPDWVLADARDLAASGMTLRKIAKTVLPATGCPDLPSCEEVLRARLAAQPASSAPEPADPGPADAA